MADGEARTEFKDLPKHHVYGGKAALMFEASVTRGGIKTLMIEAAPSTGPRQYDWSKKISIQLTAAEIPIVAALFLGLRKKCEFSSHGEEKNKGFSGENQEKGVFFRLITKGVAYAVPIAPHDVFYVTSLLIEQLIAEHKAIKTTQDAIALVRHTSERFK